VWEFLTEPDGERAGGCSITGLDIDYTDLRQICADPSANLSDPWLLNAFSGCRGWLRTACLGEIARPVVQFELLLLQSRVYNLDLDLPV